MSKMLLQGRSAARNPTRPRDATDQDCFLEAQNIGEKPLLLGLQILCFLPGFY